MVKRLIIGAFSDGGYGLRGSIAGYDVTSNPVDNTKLSFNSDWPSILPLYQAGQFSIISGSGSASFVSQGFVPFALWYFQYDSNLGTDYMWIPAGSPSNTWINEGLPFLEPVVTMTSITVMLSVSGSMSQLELAGYGTQILYAILALQAL